MAEYGTQRREFDKRFDSMKEETNRYLAALKDLSTYVDQTRGIFNNDHSKVGKMIDHKTLLDSHATDSKRVTSSGMQTGMSDPSRPWFKLTVDDFLLDLVPDLREWLDEVQRRMAEVMQKSNLYTAFQHCYDELVQFGTGCFLILEDYEDVIRGRSFTAGEYYLSVDNKGRVNGFAREYPMTVGQMAKEFGKESLSPAAQSAFAQNQVDIVMNVRHLIEANDTRIPGQEDFTNMAFRSCYWEVGAGDRFLAKRGFKRFPVIAPRWETVTTTQVLGYGPSWHSLGDIKQLQVTTKDYLLAKEKSHNPPVVQDASVIGHANKLPGGVSTTSSNVPNTGVRAAYQVDPKIQEFIQDIEQLHARIDRKFFADVFRMISNLEGQPNITAYQIAQMKQEQMMLLGPILQNSNKEMHSPTIDLIYETMSDAGMIPPPPQGLEGVEIKIQFISILAQAQKAAGVAQIEYTMTTLGNLSTTYPGITDNIDMDESARAIAEGNGIPGKCIANKDKVEAVRAQRQDQVNKQIALESGVQMADAAAKLGKTPADQGSVLDKVSQAVSG